MTNQTRNQPGKPGAVGPVMAGAGEDVFDPSAGDDTFQGAESLASGPGREGVDLLADVDHRSLLTSHGVVANSCWQEAFLLATPLDGIASSPVTLASLVGWSSRLELPETLGGHILVVQVPVDHAILSIIELPAGLSTLPESFPVTVLPKYLHSG